MMTLNAPSVCRLTLCAGLLLLSCLLAVPRTSAGVMDPSLQQAISLMRQQEFSQALALLHEVESRLPNPEEVSGLLAEAYLGLGYQEMQRGEYEAALNAFTDGGDYADDDVRFLRGEALVWFQAGQYATAASLLDQALGMTGDQSEIYLLLGKALYADGQMPQAIDALKRARETGDASIIDPLLDKVRQEWQIEQDLEQDARGHFLLSYAEGQQADLAASILDVLEEAYADVGARLAYFPEVKVPVILYSRQSFSMVTGSPDWAGAVYDGKIRIPLGGVKQITPQLRALLYHEYTHVLVRHLARNRVPTWLNEGLAETSGRSINDPPLDHLSSAVRDGQLLSWERLSKSFAGLSDEQALLAYEQSYALTRFMADQYGWDKMRDLLIILGGGVGFEAAVKTAYDSYGLGWPEILSEWQATGVR
jgi:tetratricopeptide (TPR) repeat protein